MGLFDISIKKELSLKSKDEPLNLLSEQISSDSKDSISTEKNKFTLDNFSPKGIFLKFNLEVKIENENKKDFLTIDGELQQVLLFVILIVLSILFTYGIGVILIIGFIYYQKHTASKYLNHILDKIFYWFSFYYNYNIFTLTLEI